MSVSEAQIKFKALAWLSLAVCGPLSIALMIKFYAGIPERLQEFRETYASESAKTNAELRRLATESREQTETLKDMATLRERVALIERSDREQDKRLDKLEDPPGLFSGKKK